MHGQLSQLLYRGCLVYYLSITGIYGLDVKITQGALVMRNTTRMYPGTRSMSLQTSICAGLGVGMRFSLICAGLGVGMRFSLLCANKCCSILGTNLLQPQWVDPLAKPSEFWKSLFGSAGEKRAAPAKVIDAHFKETSAACYWLWILWYLHLRLRLIHHWHLTWETIYLYAKEHLKCSLCVPCTTCAILATRKKGKYHNAWQKKILSKFWCIWCVL